MKRESQSETITRDSFSIWTLVIIVVRVVDLEFDWYCLLLGFKFVLLTRYFALASFKIFFFHFIFYSKITQ